MIKLFTIGGYNEVGKNMTALQVDDDVFLFDCGLYLPPIVEMQEQEIQKEKPTEKKLRHIAAIPNDLILENLGLRSKVRAIFLSHAHLDHIGAIPYIAPRYNAEVIGTPYTIEVLKSIILILPEISLIAMSIYPWKTVFRGVSIRKGISIPISSKPFLLK